MTNRLALSIDFLVFAAILADIWFDRDVSLFLMPEIDGLIGRFAFWR